MSDAVSDPVVWLPFHAEDLDEVPSGLRIETHRPREGWTVPDSVEEVELFVPAYDFSPEAGRVMAQMPRLRVVQLLTAGVEHIRSSVPDGVLLCNGGGIHDTSTAELAVLLALASLNRLPEFHEQQQRTDWSPHWRRSLFECTVVVVGAGRIGRAIEARLRPFEVADVLLVGRTPRDGVHGVEELPDLLPRADVVVLVLPATAESRGLFDAAMLARMPDGALIVNVARGPVVDTDALLAELVSGRLHAGLDVVAPEPLPADHPLWRAPNLVLTPHVGGASSAMWPRAHRLVREQLERFAAGEDLVNQMTGDY